MLALMQMGVGNVAVVTGAASGIGAAIATRMVSAGVSVVLADIDATVLAETVERLQANGGDVAAAPVDVTDPESVEALAAFAVERFGALHIAVNSAGVVNRGLAWELSLEEWRRVVDIDLWGVIHGVRAFVPRILESGGPGHVVNVASMASVAIIPRLGPYTVAKHGVLGLSDVLRADLAEVGAPVGVSVVMPGRVRTRMNPIGVLPPEVVAECVADAIEADRPYVFTDHESEAAVAERLGLLISSRAHVPSSEP